MGNPKVTTNYQVEDNEYDAALKKQYQKEASSGRAETRSYDEWKSAKHLQDSTDDFTQEEMVSRGEAYAPQEDIDKGKEAYNERHPNPRVSTEQGAMEDYYGTGNSQPTSPKDEAGTKVGADQGAREGAPAVGSNTQAPTPQGEIDKSGQPLKKSSTSDPNYIPVTSYPYPRALWSLTSELDICTKQDPINFFINPKDITINFPLRAGEQEMYGGVVATFWRRPKKRGAGVNVSQGKNANQCFFPYIEITFTMQLGNINPIPYASISDSVKGAYSVPPGVSNLYRLISMLNQPRVLEQDDNNKIKQGQPNYFYLTTTTRLFPHVQWTGYILTGIEGLNENAEEPWLREINMTFKAIKSLPDLFSSLSFAQDTMATQSALWAEYIKEIMAGYGTLQTAPTRSEQKEQQAQDAAARKKADAEKAAKKQADETKALEDFYGSGSYEPKTAQDTWWNNPLPQDVGRKV